MLSRTFKLLPYSRVRITPRLHDEGLEGLAGYGRSALEDVLQGRICASDVLVIFMAPRTYRATLIANDNWRLGRKHEGLERDVALRFLTDNGILVPMADVPDTGKPWLDINQTEAACQLEVAEVAAA